MEENKEIEIEISQNGAINDNSADRRVSKPEMNNHLDLDSPIQPDNMSVNKTAEMQIEEQ